MPDCPRRIGVFGGTFDPIHSGHLCIAEEARDSLGLAQVLFIPARVSPFKLEQMSATAEDRLAMVQLAVADNPAFRALRLEIDRPGPSFTVDTLRALRVELGEDCELVLILGGDALASLASWREARTLPDLARIAVYPRPGAAPNIARLEQDLPGLRAAIVDLDAVQMDISASEIRQRVQDGRSIRYLVPAPVEAFIREHHLYLTERDGARQLRRCPCL